MRFEDAARSRRDPWPFREQLGCEFFEQRKPVTGGGVMGLVNVYSEACTSLTRTTVTKVIRCSLLSRK